MSILSPVPKRPAFRYYGGKWNLAPWVIAHFPPHKNYLEPCGGAASVLLQKPRSPLETYNDLDGAVVNFFRVLRDRSDDLIKKIALTPWAREEYESSLEPHDDDVERARRFFINCAMAIGGKWSGWRSITDVTSRGGTSWPQDTVNITHLTEIAARLHGVQIERLHYRAVIAKYDNVDALIYFDPPYVTETRERGGRYNVEFNLSDHIESAELLRSVAGLVVVSGYSCPLYTELYEDYGWHRVDREANTNSGGKRVESLWISPRTWGALNHDVSNLPLFKNPPTLPPVHKPVR